MAVKGTVAAGHELTVQAADEILRAGGNAFDAILAAHFAACAVEPVLASLGGGGFLLAIKHGSRPIVYDFFVHTPQCRRPPDQLDFRPITADFGPAQQEFHIGLGTIATPGSVKAVFEIHRDLCSLPLSELAIPAIQFAREGVKLNRLQAYILSIVHSIYASTPEARKIFCNQAAGNRSLAKGEILYQREFADTLEILTIEGEDLFYRGEIAQTIVQTCLTGGGHLTLSDLEQYEVIRREPLALRYRDSTILTVPPPSSGGILVAFALKLLTELDSKSWAFGSATYLQLLAKVLALTNKARSDLLRAGDALSQVDTARLLENSFLQRYRAQLSGRGHAPRGTTHISIMDAPGNVASMTVSNGEGCGSIVPDTGIMLNNMLGEEDLNPQGFHQWVEAQRMSSMMAPSIIQLPDGSLIATGSGGSNRIRSALLQVIINLIDFGMSVESAVHSPRIHLEGNKLSIEGGFKVSEIEQLITDYPEHEIWSELNLFFGGAHTVQKGLKGFTGVGDPRRGGVGRVVE